MIPFNERYRIIPYKYWEGPNGRKASIYGAVPYRTEAEKKLWEIKTRGFTIEDRHTNTCGMGRPPFKTREDAQRWLDNWEKKINSN